MIEPFLIFNNLFGYIDGTIPCPPRTVTSGTTISDSPSYPYWISNDAHVRIIITSTISEAAFQHVQGLTSIDVWLSLECAYAPNTSSLEYTLKTQLLILVVKGDEKATDYLTRAQEYATALANVGESMMDKDLVMLVISGLKEEYNGLKSTLLTQHPPVTFNELRDILYDLDTGFSNQFSWASTQIMVYGHCNRREIGHQPSYCPNQSSSSTSRQPPQANFANFSNVGSQYEAMWKPDRGANIHASPYLSSLDYSELYQDNDSLHVDDGRVYPHYPSHGSK